jgi:hypothetical protein
MAQHEYYGDSIQLQRTRRKVWNPVSKLHEESYDVFHVGPTGKKRRLESGLDLATATARRLQVGVLHATMAQQR